MREYLHAVVYPAQNIPGDWIAHCLDVDILSQGCSQQNALDLLTTSITLSREWAKRDCCLESEERAVPIDILIKYLEMSLKPIRIRIS
jgi:hypothetical protein